MDIRRLSPGVIGYSNLSDGKNEYIVKSMEEAVSSGAIQWHEAQTAADKDAENIKINYEKRRGLNIGLFPELANSDNPYLKELHNVSKYMYDITKPAVDHYKSVYHTYDCVDYFGWVVLKYRKDDFFTAHTDASHDFPRQMSLVYYVNNDYEGGELEFPHIDLKIKPLKDELIIFPANYLFLHSANPVTSGIKYSVINFIN